MESVALGCHRIENWYRETKNGKMDIPRCRRVHFSWEMVLLFSTLPSSVAALCWIISLEFSSRKQNSNWWTYFSCDIFHFSPSSACVCVYALRSHCVLCASHASQLEKGLYHDDTHAAMNHDRIFPSPSCVTRLTWIYIRYTQLRSDDSRARQIFHLSVNVGGRSFPCISRWWIPFGCAMRSSYAAACNVHGTCKTRWGCLLSPNDRLTGWLIDDVQRANKRARMMHSAVNFQWEKERERAQHSLPSSSFRRSVISSIWIAFLYIFFIFCFY